MNKLYTVITCLFGYYDKLKEPEEVDPNAEYICFTDRTDIVSNAWKLINVYDNTPYNSHGGNSFQKEYFHIFPAKKGTNIKPSTNKTLKKRYPPNILLLEKLSILACS